MKKEEELLCHSFQAVIYKRRKKIKNTKMEARSIMIFFYVAIVDKGKLNSVI